MPYQNVDIFIVDDTTAKAAVPGVVVRIFNDLGAIFFSESTTDTSGRASFSLPGGQTFQLRFYKFQTSFVQPQQIEVVDNPVSVFVVTQEFEVVAHIFHPPESTDPRLCRVSGFFRDATGAPRKYVDVHLLPQFDPILLEGSAVLDYQVRARSDEKGYVEFDLIRLGKYDVMLEGFEDCLRVVHVPDATHANFPDLLFPVIERVEFSPEGPYTMQVGKEVLITPTVYATDGRIIPDIAASDVRWSSGNDQIAAVLPAGTTITLRGIAAGSTELKAERVDTSIIRIPNTPIAGVPVTLTVTP